MMHVLFTIERLVVFGPLLAQLVVLFVVPAQVLDIDTLDIDLHPALATCALYPVGLVAVMDELLTE